MLWTEKAKKYLKKYWNIDSLKEKQYEAINELLLGNDVIALFNTGYGKTLCYHIPPIITKKIMIIISPLISLMDDQKEKLDNMNIPCSVLHSNNSNKNQEIKQIMNGEIRIVYMSPEYLINGYGLELCSELIEIDKLGYFAIDEAHCISMYGCDFRPEYGRLKKFRELFPDIPIIALTATATEIVCNDIIKLLNMNNPVTVKTSFDRPNLYLKIEDCIREVTKKTRNGIKTENKQIPKEELVIPYIEKYINDKIIIYTNTRKDTESLSDKLIKLNYNCDAYHAGLSKQTREDIQQRFSEGETKIIISTTAFGMGIDQIVRCVIVIGYPSSIEEFYQQIGRGGRDGLKCETILYYNTCGYKIAEYMLKDIKMNNPLIYKVKLDNLKKVKNMRYVKTCRRKYILEYFNEKCDFFTCGNCDNCCEQKLTDMTTELWSLIFKSNNLLNVISEIKKKYIENNDLDLLGPLIQWKKYIIENNISLDKLPNNLKILLPNNCLKIINDNYEETFDDKISKYNNLIINL